MHHITVALFLIQMLFYMLFYKYVHHLCLVYSLQTSEDSLSQGTGGVSEMSDEAMPILGRRATREKINSASRYSDDSDSDIDIYKVIHSNLDENIIYDEKFMLQILISINIFFYRVIVMFSQWIYPIYERTY